MIGNVRILLALLTLLPASLLAQSEKRMPAHNPMFQRMHYSSPAYAQKATGARSWLIASFTANSGASSGPYYSPQDSTAYTYSGGRGGAPVAGTPAGWSFSFSTDDIPYDTATLYNGWTDVTPTFNLLGLKRIRSYDVQGNMLSDLQQAWPNGVPRDYYRSLYTYTAASAVATILTQSGMSGTLVDNSKDSFEYNAAGQRTASYSLYWYTSPPRWVNGFAHYFFYDAAGNLTLDSTEQWNNITWKPYQKDQYSYNAAGMLTLYTVLSPSASGWKFHDDETRYYNAANQLLSAVTRDSFHYAATGHYRNQDSMVSTVNSAGLPLITIDYTQRNSSTWEAALQYTMTYNSFGQVLSELGTHWQNNSWMVDPSAWDPEYKYYYATDSIAPTAIRNTSLPENSMVLYPLPAKDRLHLTWADASLAGRYSAAVMNASGQVVMQWQADLSAHHQELDISPLAPGQYWLRLQGAKGQLSEKFSVVY